jgi:hypothetical protein
MVENCIRTSTRWVLFRNANETAHPDEARFIDWPETSGRLRKFQRGVVDWPANYLWVGTGKLHAAESYLRQPGERVTAAGSAGPNPARLTLFRGHKTGSLLAPCSSEWMGNLGDIINSLSFRNPFWPHLPAWHHPRPLLLAN